MTNTATMHSYVDTVHFVHAHFSLTVSVAKRFEEEYGVVRLSVGEAMRSVLQSQPHSELARSMNRALLRGMVVSEELQVQALEVVMLDMRCQTRG